MSEVFHADCHPLDLSTIVERLFENVEKNDILEQGNTEEHGDNPQREGSRLTV